MAAATFTWCDLSTFRPSVTKPFYSRLLGWHFDGTGDYDLAAVGKAEVAAVFQMPGNLQKIGMPSFWMSYISVTNVSETVEIARGSGGRIELERSDHALIRDPLGAGFTVYSGAWSVSPEVHGTRAGHAYFCSDISAVEEFYNRLFGWTFDAHGDDVWRVGSPDGMTLAFAYQQPDTVRGKEQYWAVLFRVDDLPASTEAAMASGATGHVSTVLQQGPAALIYDPDGAAFFLIEQA